MTTVKQTELAIHGGTPVRREPLPWELPGAHWMGKEELDMVGAVIRARSPFRYYGPDPQHMVERLEQVFRERLQRPHALGVASATAGLYCALGALEIGPGDEVLVPGYHWCSCLSAIVRTGAIPRLVDIDNTFCMDPADMRRKITPRTKAAMIVHMSGAPGRLDEQLEVCRHAGIRVVEDCAQANGAVFRGRQVGTFGDLAVFSFQLNKNMTSGEGGMIVCNDAHLYKRAFALHDMGFARNEAGRLDPQDARYQLWGIGARMSELAGAMALAQLGKLDRITGAMRRAKLEIKRQLQGIRGLSFRHVPDPAGDSGPFLITVYRDTETCRNFTEALQAEGIRGPEGSMSCVTMREWGLHWYFNNPSLTNRRGQSPDGWPWTHPANGFAKDYTYGSGALPVCDDMAARSGLLTIASCLSDGDVQDIVTAFRKVAAVILK